MTLRYLRTRRAFIAELLATSSVLGCERRRVTESDLFNGDEKKFFLTLVFDLSGSFYDFMVEQGKAYDFAMTVVDHYYREHVGGSATLVIAQVSGNARALLWEGHPLELRREFRSPSQFREFLMKSSDPSGSLVNAAIANAIEYSLAEPSVAKGTAKTAILVLSDMLENSADSDPSEERVIEALAEYGKLGGRIGLYYVETELVPLWRERLAAAGLKQFQVSSDIERNPPLPSFEQR